jgi:L-amino acid N-acyltransferase YncA
MMGVRVDMHDPSDRTYDESSYILCATCIDGHENMHGYDIVPVDTDNMDELGFFCVKSKAHPGYIAKRRWLKQRFAEGMRVKLLRNAMGRDAGFIEYIPGEYTWRTINAAGYLVIHCLWLKSHEPSGKGLASLLIDDCVRDARENGFRGVAVVTSDGPWMAGGNVYLKNDFERVDTAEPYYQLLVRNVGKSVQPSFPTNWEQRLQRFEGLHCLYTMQCPYTGKVMRELPDVARRHGIMMHEWELHDSAEAREIMPSPYGMFALVHDGRLLADHPVSTTRFSNILRKDLGRREISL